MRRIQQRGFFKTLKPELVWRAMSEGRRDADQAMGR